MRVVVTGAGGFLGQRLAELIVRKDTLAAAGERQTVEELILFDAIEADGPKDRRARALVGDIRDREALARAITKDTQSVFHLASVVSGEAEADFDKGMAINLDGMRGVLDVCRALPHAPRLVFASSVAAFGGELPDVVTDDTAPTPQSSYGIQKVIGELLVADYTRRGFIDGRAVRIPTVTVRPGKPNKAASGFASGIVREPLNDQQAVCPVPAETRMWITSPRTAVDNLLHAHELAPALWGDVRAINLPGLSVSVGEMIAALGRVAGEDAVEHIVMEPDGAIEAIVAGWPGDFDTARANAMGFGADDNFDEIIRAYLADELSR
ncbi:MAG: D-erythronate dehydrogenase [Gammaproteobacteria bacterium]